ncbi:hypothetical protein [Streptomyces sp. NPDC096339]|uniref:hypothetical protein n=1 Tax=Streptomyces sp. NPDC096339 TaxID=3366086 RepID=UPI00381C96B3
MHVRHFIPALVICVSLTGCGGGSSEPEAGDSPPPSPEEIVYHDCLKKQGVEIVYTDNGTPRVNKDKPWNEEAHGTCAPLLPPPVRVAISPERLAAARKVSACLRAEGVTWYPDPDLVTGEVNDTMGGTQEQWSNFKVKHIDALMKCRKDR